MLVVRKYKERQKIMWYPYPSRDISNSTNEGAKQMLCGSRLRGVVMEIRLMAAWRAISELSDICDVSEPRGA